MYNSAVKSQLTTQPQYFPARCLFVVLEIWTSTGNVCTCLVQEIWGEPSWSGGSLQSEPATDLELLHVLSLPRLQGQPAPLEFIHSRAQSWLSSYWHTWQFKYLLRNKPYAKLVGLLPPFKCTCTQMHIILPMLEVRLNVKIRFNQRLKSKLLKLRVIS